MLFSKIKVLWLCPYPVSELRGHVKIDRLKETHSSSWIKTLSSALASFEGIELHILTRSQYVDDHRFVVKDGIHFHIIRDAVPFTNSGYPELLPFDKLLWYWPFINVAKKYICNKIKPDVIHAHGTEGAYGLLARRLKPVVSIVSIQGLIGEIVKFEHAKWSGLKLRQERSVITSLKHFGCRTHFDSGYVKRLNSKAEIHFMPEAMNEVFFQTEWKGSLSFIITFVGTLCERKGVFDLIKAVAGLDSSIELHLIGEGSEADLERIKKESADLDMTSRLRILGRLEAFEIAHHLSESRIFVLPSHIENSPNSLAEAQAIGMPVVASNVGGISSMIDDQESGLLAAANDTSSLHECIKRIFEDDILAEKLAFGSRKHALENYFPERVVNQTVKVYKELLSTD